MKYPIPYQIYYNGPQITFTYEEILELPFDKTKNVFLYESEELCTKIFENYRFTVNGLPVRIYEVYRYITFEPDSLSNHGIHGMWDIELTEHYVADVENYGLIELKGKHIEIINPSKYNPKRYSKLSLQIEETISEDYLSLPFEQYLNTILVYPKQEINYEFA